MSKTYIGIDPGASGAITVMYQTSENKHIANDFEVKSWIVPTIGKEIDVHSLSRILVQFAGPEPVHCVIEDVHAIFGSAAKSTFKFGYVVGILEGLLVAHHIPFTKVQPKAWQAKMFQGIPLQTKLSATGKTTQTDTKLMALMAAKRLFPDYNFIATERSKKDHDGIVDSLLMADFCRRYL